MLKLISSLGRLGVARPDGAFRVPLAARWDADLLLASGVDEVRVLDCERGAVGERAKRRGVVGADLPWM